MENTSPCLYWPRDIGPYAIELSNLYCYLSNIKDNKDILITVRQHLLNLPNYAQAELPRLRYYAYLLVLIDLLRQDWHLLCRQGRFYFIPPHWTEDVRGTEAVQAQKAAIRASLKSECLTQLRKPSVRAFIRKMERPYIFKGKSVSIFSLYANGKQLAQDLTEVHSLTDLNKRTEAVCNVIQPYLQQVTPEDRCEFTGYLLNDIWRYIRYTWSIPYNSTPGRNIFYLVRDASRPFHPIIGIAALGSSLVQLTARDNIIGWTLQSTLERIRGTQFTSEDAQRIASMLKSTLQSSLSDLDTADLDLKSDELTTPNEEIILRLGEIAKDARERRIALLQNHRNHRLITAEQDEVSLFPNNLENGLETIDHLEEQISYYLFKAKRAEILLKLLSAKITLEAFSFDINTAEGLRSFVTNDTGRQTLQTLIRENKKRKVGINMMDIIVCGAVPPYNYILGGKLVAMLMVSPQVISEYEQKYKNYKSDIASKMKNDVVSKYPKMVFLGTTSLYHSGSSQYNRISIPTPDGKNILRYENYGKTLGFGSVHYSEETVKALKELQENTQEARLINNRFGEGVNPKLRRVRSGLANIGLENSDYFLNHRSKRIIYGIPLGKSTYAFLRGENDDPEYFFDLSTVEAIQAGTCYISEFWAKRWLLMRIQNPEVLQNIFSFKKADIALSSFYDSKPEILEDLQQYKLFGGTT